MASVGSAVTGCEISKSKPAALAACAIISDLRAAYPLPLSGYTPWGYRFRTHGGEDRETRLRGDNRRGFPARPGPETFPRHFPRDYLPGKGPAREAQAGRIRHVFTDTSLRVPGGSPGPLSLPVSQLTLARLTVTARLLSPSPGPLCSHSTPLTLRTVPARSPHRFPAPLSLCRSSCLTRSRWMDAFLLSPRPSKRYQRIERRLSLRPAPRARPLSPIAPHWWRGNVL